MVASWKYCWCNKATSSPQKETHQPKKFAVMNRNGSMPQGKRLHVYRSGDASCAGKSVTFNPIFYKTMDTFLNEVQDKVPILGAVRSIHTPNTGTVIPSLSALKKDGKYVAAGPRGFVSVAGGYQNIGKPLIKNRAKNQKTLRKRVPIAKPITVFIHKNGDNSSLPKSLVIEKEDLASWTALVRKVNGQVDLNEGSVARLYDLNGKIMSNKQLTNNGTYVAASSHEGFRALEYINHSESNLKTLRRPTQKDTNYVKESGVNQPRDKSDKYSDNGTHINEDSSLIPSNKKKWGKSEDQNVNASEDDINNAELSPIEEDTEKQASTVETSHNANSEDSDGKNVQEQYETQDAIGNEVESTIYDGEKYVDLSEEEYVDNTSEAKEESEETEYFRSQLEMRAENADDSEEEYSIQDTVTKQFPPFEERGEVLLMGRPDSSYYSRIGTDQYLDSERDNITSSDNVDLFHAKPKGDGYKQTIEVDYDKDQYGIFRAKSSNVYCLDATVVLENSLTNVDTPVDLMEASEVEESY